MPQVVTGLQAAAPVTSEKPVTPSHAEHARSADSVGAALWYVPTAQMETGTQLVWAWDETDWYDWPRVHTAQLRLVDVVGAAVWYVPAGHHEMGRQPVCFGVSWYVEPKTHGVSAQPTHMAPTGQSATVAALTRYWPAAQAVHPVAPGLGA